ncbi:extracellular solute-binding protein [Kaistia terrae]|uniref:Extracellular solute-binding protein n=1 Tax=Kaistia terrae TaxID=537017 RepID=A0ABW0PZ97_9HYPH|nr:extracellular solute-binding protein [Kaistia terrae]MCX5580512.1 extracellular solute-binding protein [Kaistia terrae]
MRFRIAIAAAAMTFASMLGASAQTTVRMLTPEKNPKINAFWESVIQEYQTAHPDVSIEQQYMSGDAMMAKLPTMLSSSAAPDIFFSWGGGVMRSLSQTGAIKDLTADFDADGGAWRKSYSPAAVDAFSFDGKVWAVPYKLSMINFYYNKDLFEKAGVDGDAIRSWDDFLAAIAKLKAAGITPIAVGAKDKWPVHFYWAYLALREGGSQSFIDAKAKRGDGFKSDSFVKAGELLQKLGEAAPFQRGFEAAGWGETLTDFADGRAAMVLGFSDTPENLPDSATDKKGIGQEKIGMFAFPSVPGGKGDPAETFGGNNAWLVYKDAKPEAVDFLRYATSPANQARYAALNADIPVVASAASEITNPLLKSAAESVGKSPFHQNFLDQDLGPDVGWGVVNQMVVELVTGEISPADAAQQIQDAWDLQ